MFANHTFFSPQTLQGLQLATQFRPGALAPLLTHLEWISAERLEMVLGLSHVERVYPFVALLLAESIVSLRMSFYTYIQVHTSTVAYTLGRLPHLRVLRLRTETPGVALDTYLGPQTWGLDNLQSLHISSTITSSIQHLASLPRLQTLEIDHLFSSADPAPLRPKPPAGFTSLRSLTVSFATVEDFAELISHMEPQSNTIQSIDARLKGPSPQDRLQAQGVLNEILERANLDTLTYLDICLGPEPSDFVFGEEQIDTATEDLYQPDGQIDFSALLKLKNLERLHLGTTETIRITPEDALRIPLQWPMINHLGLGGGHPCRTVPQIDHTHLLAILEGCPALDTLFIQFDASRITGKERSRTGPFGLSLCNVGDSPIYSASRVTEFFKTNFPNLSGFAIHHNYARSGTPQPSTFERRWSLVEAAVKERIGGPQDESDS